MYKLYLILFLLLSPIVTEIFPQVNYSKVTNVPDGINVYLRFDKEPFSIKKEDGKEVVEYTNALNEGMPGSPVIPKKSIIIAIPPYSKVNPVIAEKKQSSVSNVDISLNPVLELNDEVIQYKSALPGKDYFTGDIYPNKEIEVTGYTWIKNYYCAVIQINTHRYNWKKKELTEIFEADLKISFSGEKPFDLNIGEKSVFEKSLLSKVILNYESADLYRTFRPSAPDTTGNWIDYTKEYVKLAVYEDGIYKISYKDLLNYGVDPAAINPLTLKIFFEGKQIPVFISGENDLSFDQQDYLEFWGEKNYGSPGYREIVPVGADYKNYFDRYNDTNFVWLTWGGENGIRTDSIDNFIPGLSDTVKTNLVKLHLENDMRLWYYDALSPRVQLPYWQENKVWTWHFLGNGGSIPFTFNSPDFVPGTIVNTTTRLISNAADINVNAHSNGASINSTIPSDTIAYDFKQTVNFSAGYISDILNQTGNIFRIFGLPTSAGFHQSLIDWIDIEYFRYNNAINDSILISIPDSEITSLKTVVVNNISDAGNIFIYRIKPQLKRITAFNFASGTLAFTDTVSGGNEYLIIKDEMKKSPGFVVKKQFQNLRNNSRIADYIILTNKILEESSLEYKNFIEAEYNLNVELVFVNDVYDEFSYGLDNAGVIKDFLIAANQYWQFPKPSYLTIIGDANYDYKEIIIPPNNIRRKNLVPSYGHPVSDSWFAVWDSSNTEIPQMFVGRIPAGNNDDVNFYLQKHQTYVNRPYDSWNKNYLFFSGGDINNPSQLLQIKSANEGLLNNLVEPEPVGGSGIHFYKTINPLTNYGPYAFSEVLDAIDNGGLFISYIGHSGTQTWDNGITSVEDLRNRYSDRNPLVTDFGCSTGKFAEPDIDAFGELFLLDDPGGQAINYLGNASWGYLSTSLRFPELFYSQILIDSASSVGEAHLIAKMQQFNQSGFTDVNRVFNFCNILFGDPVINFKTPPEPNLNIRESSFTLLTENPNDMTDSIKLRIEILNAGRVIDDSLTISVTNRWMNQTIFQTELTIPLPLFKDTLIINMPVDGKVGQHIVEVNLDIQNEIDELYENDNSAQYLFTVYSTSVRPVEDEKFYTASRDSLKVLNPTLIADKSLTEIVVSLSDNPAFNNAAEITKNMDTIFSTINLNSLQENKRYWWRTKLNEVDQEWSDIYSFYNIDKNFNWYVDGQSFNNSDFEYLNAAYDSLENYWRLTEQENILRILSAGFYAGQFASVLYNGQEFLSNTFFWGIATAELDSVTLKPFNIKYFLQSHANAADSLITYLNSLTNGSLLAMAICDDGAQSVLGFGGGTPVRRAIENFGSYYIDSVRYRESWCIIGKKGAPQGSVPESYKRGSDIAETGNTVILNNRQGYILFPLTGKSYNWINIEKQDLLPSGTSVEYIPLGIKQNGDVDTLDALTFTNNSSSLNHIDAATYPMLKILTRLNTNDLYTSPSVSIIGINYTIPPELALNYQVVNVSSDSLFVGENIILNFAVFNATETHADSFKIIVEVLRSNNERETISEIPINRIDSLGRNYFEVQLNTQNYSRNNNFVITVDSENKVSEIFEDNNFFQIPFYVKPDTSVPSVNITIDGVDILDGDYISTNPEIKIELHDPSMLPLTDTSSVSLFLNDEEIFFANNPDITYEFSPSNPKLVVTYKPHLSTGEYTLRVFGKNSSGTIADSAGVEKYFIVNEETEILNVYNYPNPSKGETYFTFKLTQIPDELKIKIYSVAGRLIKEINLSSSELNYDFNTVYWDGKDDDKNSIANGVYFYKVIISKDGKSQDVTEKLAIVR